MAYTRTAKAAAADKASKWVLIEAIATDARRSGLDIDGTPSQLEAKKALAEAGHEHADTTVQELCALAQFDNESTDKQRAVWRCYGWTSVSLLRRAGWSRHDAARFLAGKRKTRRDIKGVLATRPASREELPLDDAWDEFLTKMYTLLLSGAKLANRSTEENVQLGTRAELGYHIYQRIAEHNIDAEARAFFEQAEAQLR